MADTLATGLQAHYRFSNNLTDSSGNNRTLLVGDSSNFATDKDGNVNSCMGAGSYLGLNEKLILNTNNEPFSFTIWFEKNSLTTNQILIGNGSYGQGGCYIQQNSSGFQIIDASVNLISTIANIPDGWNFLSVKYNGTSRSVKLNGVLKLNENVGLSSPSNSYTKFAVGCYTTRAQYPWKSKFDEVRVYNRALTDEEETLIYSKGVNYNPDTTPPSFNSISINTITYNSANLNVNSNEDGKVYYKILSRNATAPTSAELKANPDGQTNVTANTTSIISLTGLTSNANLDCYVVAEDTVPNLQLEPTKIEFTTPPAPTGEVITSTDKNYKTSINSTSMRFVVKPNTKYTFGLQAIRTTKEGIIATNIIQNEVITTPNKSNFKGVVQVTDDANYLYQKTTLRLGQNALGAGVDKDGMYVGNTGIDNTPTNYLKFNTSIGTFDLKSTGNIRFTNGISNELFFDSGTTTNSFLKMNSGSQQLGLCTDSGGSYQGLFVGDTTLTNGKYFKYDGTDLKVGKNVKFNWIDTLSDDATQSLQYLMNKTIDQMLKGTTTYTDNLITVRSSDDGTEKAYLGDMGANGFGLKIDSDVNNYFYANTVDGVKFKTNKDVNISNTTNEINFDSTTSTNSFIKVNDGSQQLGRVSVSNMPYVYSGATGTSGTYILYAIEADITSILSVGDEIKIEQSGKATTTTVITNISFYSYKTTISIGTALADTYTIGDIRKTKFNGVYFGNKKRLTGNELYKDSLGLNFSGKYFNKTAYCETTDEFLGALDTSKPILSYKVSKIPNPFYNKEINNIVLTAKDDYIISSNFVYYDSAPIVDYANIASMPTTREVTPTKYRDLSTGYIYIQDWELGDNTVHYELYDINILIYRGDALTEHDGFHFSPYTTIGGVDFTSKYYAVPITEGRTRYYISKSLLGSKETLTSEGRGIIFIIYPAYIIGYIGSHFGEDNLIIPNENIKSIKSLHSSTECTIDFANAFEGYRSSNIGMVCKNEILIENLCLKNLGSASLYMGIYPALLLLGEDSGLNNVRFINLKSQVYGSNKRNNYIRNIVVESYSSSLILGISYFLNIENLTLSIQRSLTGSLVYGCSNIKGLGIQGGDKTISTLLSSTDGYILSCHNISNVWIQSNLYKNLFYNCININNIKVIVSNGGSAYFNSATDYYYFKNCFSINNINFYYTDLADNNTFMYNCNYITNVIGLERKHVDFATISLRYDTNNTWNLKRDIVLDTLLPTTEYTSYSSKLIPQLLHIYIKETTTRFVTSGVDLDIDSSAIGSCGLYKFIYNNSLSQWELHQLTLDRDITNGSLIRINFSIAGEDVIFSVKSNTTTRYITILAEEIK